MTNSGWGNYISMKIPIVVMLLTIAITLNTSTGTSRYDVSVDVKEGCDCDIPTIIMYTLEGNYSAYAINKDGVIIYESNGTTENVDKTLELIYDEIFKNN